MQGESIVSLPQNSENNTNIISNIQSDEKKIHLNEFIKNDNKNKKNKHRNLNDIEDVNNY